MQDLEQNKAAESLEAGTYEIIRKRLQTQKDALSTRLNSLNEARKDVFTSSDLTLIANQRINTENNCVSRGIMALGNLYIFGYNVHFGLRTDIQLSDVFSIYTLENNQFVPQTLELIDDPVFITDYKNLYKYYRDSIFSKFRRTENYLYMVFQTSKSIDGLKAFKWLIKGNKLIYQDDRSIHEVVKAPQFEFKWIKTTLEDRRLGVYPHVSILDKVFIEAVGGDITFKIEDNTQTGKGIYSEKVENKDQQLDDAEYYYADLGNLILVRIKPYQEDFRTFVFNTRTKEVLNIKMLNDAGILLPDNHGIIFPNGYYLQNGDHKIFESELNNLEFFRKVASPNGEDFLYIFYQNERNIYVIMSYNIIRQQVETPIICNGFTLSHDGTLIFFRSEQEASRHHQVQIWQTPYSARLIENYEKKDNILYKIGNKDIVKAMAECQEVIHLINKEDTYEGLYEDIVKKSNDIVDAYFWVSDEATYKLAEPLVEIKEIANTAIDEFEKVKAQKKYAADILEATVNKVDALLFSIKNAKFDSLDKLVKLLAETRRMQGEVIELNNQKYIDTGKIEELKETLIATAGKLSDKTVEFLLRDEALIPYETKVADQKKEVESVLKVIDANKIEENCKLISSELELLIDILNSLKIDDTTQTTKIIEKISLIFASLNEVRAQLKKKVDSLKNKEAAGEFRAQLTLLEQSIVNYLELATSPEKSDEYFTKVSVQIEELESKFADFDDFIVIISDKRNEVVKVFDARKAQLIEQINRRTSSLEQIGLRVLKNVENKAQSFKSKEEIQAFYSTDLMVDKVHKLVEDLKNLGDVSKAENLENSLKTSLEDALRILKDKSELFVDGENIIALGNHKFAVNKQSLDLTVVRRDDRLLYHLTGTNFYHEMQDGDINRYRDIWEQEVVSENNLVYRAEYLAYLAFNESLKSKDFNLQQFISGRVEQSYSESYMKGVHDADAITIFEKLTSIHQQLGLLSFRPQERVAAQLFWHSVDPEDKKLLNGLIVSANNVLKAFPASGNYQYVIREIQEMFVKWNTRFNFSRMSPEQIAIYLFCEFAENPEFTVSEQAQELEKEFTAYLKKQKLTENFKTDLAEDSFSDVERFYLVRNWLLSFIDLSEKYNKYKKYVGETSCLLLLTDFRYELRRSPDQIEIADLRGSHPVIVNNLYSIDYHDFIQKLTHFYEISVPTFNEFTQLKDKMIASYRKSLKINELKPRVLTSFVRNKLINQTYLPLIGANLAKQLGVAGDNKRTARMGMLLLISPPGYGKTTLMEYLANIMGLNFVKINGPTIGHSITSIDPAEAKTSGAREELKKINLAFEMADNVMLYVDDIQHCSSEFLQKFISLADGQRKMDGIFEGDSKTYDLRGKRFCVIMAGNPYTESGEKFQIPDMLANRADVYNLGDVIGGSDTLFKLSLLENAIVENPYMQKIASKSFTDFYNLVDYVETKSEMMPDLEGNHMQQDVDDFIAVVKNSLSIRDIVLKVNQNYIASAAMQDTYRTEPSFKLQGSYRDMNKLVSQIVPLMNKKEISELILTHYESESQTLTADSEANILKLKEIAGLLSGSDSERWIHIKEIFNKNNKFGSIDQNNQTGLVIAQLAEFNDNLEGIKKAITKK
ncbi:MoxR-like ATPase [Dysgonomonas sp. PFB1-18]|uniref:DNA repair ATPase n=1 Tax=unclassified Dysgonomonas TaxID=2630389 RepID=UPI002475D7C0|nr:MULTISPECIES: DNA repair ATPase [unclassified Dysgonomonas]MDH6309540.1 MoxR-like ATPase [Dysgonomonas sp. PF1-14]MDH6339132.1 MoxR-like ATPase [Dysgonomonas sp. PF1-16]MDH6380582.1 MoxR-like ATPase [Dysgonomonas sp. PFB1-18]MDH6398078.1 MoxR-like ATPase [Dysgonomonas sp. PF1-23]